MYEEQKNEGSVTLFPTSIICDVNVFHLDGDLKPGEIIYRSSNYFEQYKKLDEETVVSELKLAIAIDGAKMLDDSGHDLNSAIRAIMFGEVDSNFVINPETNEKGIDFENDWALLEILEKNGLFLKKTI